MKKHPQVSIILCTLNEAGHILELIDNIAKTFSDFEIILVDDNSTDGTFRLALEYSETHSYLRPYQRVGLRGIAGALQSGINLTRGNIVCWMHADFSHPISVLAEMVQIIQDDRADVVLGSRFIPGPKEFIRPQTNLVRIQKKFGHLLAKTGKLLLNPKIHDWSSGLLALKKSTLTGLRLKGENGEYFMELLYEIHRKNWRMMEVPFVSPPRRSGKSKTVPGFWGMAVQGRKYAFKMAKLSYLRFRQGYDRSAHP